MVEIKLLYSKILEQKMSINVKHKIRESWRKFHKLN